MALVFVPAHAPAAGCCPIGYFFREILNSFGCYTCSCIHIVFIRLDTSSFVWFIMKMDYKKDFNIFVGTKLGSLKGIKVEIIDGEWKGIVKNLQNIDVLNKEYEISAMAWGDTNESELLLGLASQTVKVYDTEFKGFTSSVNVNFGTGAICGVGRFDGAILTAVESGEVKTWKFKEESSCVINTGGPLDKMKQFSAGSNIIATGGKERDLQQWDLETQKCLFTAKNVRNNELDLRVPVWVSDIDFLGDKNMMVVCSRLGYLRLYDSRSSQRRPVCGVNIPEKALTAVCGIPSKEKHVVVGSGTGHMMLVDLRGKGLVSRHYKGSVGSIRSIACHSTEPYVASVGLDRYIKIHNLNNGKLLYKEYLSSRLSCVLMRKDFLKKPSKKCNDDDDELEIVTLSDEDEQESEMNKLFENMESVEEDPNPKKKRRKI